MVEAAELAVAADGFSWAIAEPVPNSRVAMSAPTTNIHLITISPRILPQFYDRIKRNDPQGRAKKGGTPTGIVPIISAVTNRVL